MENFCSVPPLAPEDNQTRLRDSVRPASSQVQGQSVHLSVEPGCPCLACRSRGPTGEGRDTAGPSSRDGVRVLQPLLHRTQETLWVTSNLGPACSEPGPCQAPVQDIDAETHLSMRPSLRLGCSDRPERRLLPCLDPPSIPLCVRRASIPVGPPLRAPQPVGTSGQPGKEQTLPYAEDLFSLHGVGLGQPHSTSLRGSCSVNAEMPGVSPAQESGSTETFSEAPWAYGILSRYHAARIASYETASALASRPSPEMGMAPRHILGLTHPVLPPHLQPMVGPCFLRAGVPLEQVSRHVVFSTDASTTGWGAMGNGPQLQWHINCLELLAVWLALRRFRTLLHDKHILVRSDNTATVAYINHQGGLRSRRMSQLACHLLLWSQKHLRSLRAVHVPGELNLAADELSRQPTLPGEWRLHPEVLQLIWRRFGNTQVDLFASPDTSHCQLFFSLSEGTLGTDALACNWHTDPVQGQGGRGASPLGGALLAQSDGLPRTDVPRDSPSLVNSSEEGSPFSERGHPLAPAPRLVESPRMVPGRDAEVLSGLPPAVVNTITSARALSTRQAYRLKWNLFVDWCSPRREDPRRCPIAVVLSFLQDGLERRLSPSTLKVYVAAIAAHHDAVYGKSLGKHDLVIRFLRGARRLNPPRPHLVPSWDLPSVLSALRGAPFEPLQSVELKFLSLKTVLLTALATVKRVGDLQAFSVDDSCLEFGPGDSHVVLRPRPGYVPKVPTMPFRDQVVNLQALPREEADPAIALLCPVRALRIYVDRTQSFRTSDQLFVCFGGQQKGRALLSPNKDSPTG